MDMISRGGIWLAADSTPLPDYSHTATVIGTVILLIMIVVVAVVVLVGTRRR